MARLQTADPSMFSLEIFRVDGDGRKYRACKWCGAEIPMNKNGRLVFCGTSCSAPWHAENNRRLRALGKSIQS
jgi:hypothetical protein